jgi:carboxypeptidase Q
MYKRLSGLLVLIFFPIALTVSAQSIYEPSVDHEIVEQIKEQGLHNSQIMAMASWLTDVYGPRLSNSPQLNRAHEWTQTKFREMGLSNVHLHSFGPFGKGWELQRFALHANTPYTYFPVTAYPKAWSPGYDGSVTGDVIYLGIQHINELEQFRGELNDKFVMLEFPYEPEQSWDPIASRISNQRLLNLANAKEDFSPAEEQQQTPNPPALARARTMHTLMTFLQEERPLAILDQSYRGWYGQIAVSGAQLPNEPGTPWGERTNPYMPGTPDAVPQISLAREHYGRIFRLLEKDIPVTLELELQVEFQEDDLNGYNSIAEIPGTDPELQNEIVMLGAHIDSWHASTGAADNASGTVVMMEVMRILKELGIEPRRTIRVALWGNEEQGLHGSREYVNDHFAVQNGDGSSLDKREDYENLSAYYNIDNGTGQVRGIYLQGNEQLRQIFRAWLSPFDQWDANTVSFANTGGTDHLSFHRVGLPGFQFIQDPIEYSTMTHHSNQDFFERLIEEDLKRTAVIVATFVYHTAMLDERLPRMGELDFPVTQ